MALEQITDHEARALSRVVTQLRGTEFEKLIKVFTTEIQTLENALFSLLQSVRDPAIAIGTILDRLGQLVGAEPRALLTDVEYRLRVAAAIARNRASGKTNEVISVISALIPQFGSTLIIRDATVEGVACAVATWSSFGGMYQPVTPAQAEEVMRYLSRAAGVRVILSYAPVTDFGAGTLARFDTAGQGFDGTNKMSGSVDQKTRN